EVDQVAERRAVVGGHDDVVAGVLLGLQRWPYLGVERRVVVDRLGVGDLDPGQLGEVLQRWVLALEHVDVIRPVGEVDGVVQLLLGPPRRGADAAGRRGPAAGRGRALDPARGQEPAYAERPGPGPRGPQQLAPGEPGLGQPAADGRIESGSLLPGVSAVLLFHLNPPVGRPSWPPVLA